MMTAAEIEARIGELEDARFAAIADSLEHPEAETVALSIKAEIAKLQDALDHARLVEKAKAAKEAVERQATADKEAAAKRQQAATIVATMTKTADRADVALNELMVALNEIQDAARKVYRLVPERQQSLSRILDPNKIGRAILGRRLSDGSMVSDQLGTPRPSGPRPDQTIRQFVESFT